MVNIVGDHATYHKQYDAPLESDIDALAHSRVRLGAPRTAQPQDVGCGRRSTRSPRRALPRRAGSPP